MNSSWNVLLSSVLKSPSRMLHNRTPPPRLFYAVLPGSADGRCQARGDDGMEQVKTKQSRRVVSDSLLQSSYHSAAGAWGVGEATLYGRIYRWLRMFWGEVEMEEEEEEEEEIEWAESSSFTWTSWIGSCCVICSELFSSWSLACSQPCRVTLGRMQRAVNRSGSRQDEFNVRSDA